MYSMNSITLPNLIDKHISTIPDNPPSPIHKSTTNPHAIKYAPAP